MPRAQFAVTKHVGGVRGKILGGEELLDCSKNWYDDSWKGEITGWLVGITVVTVKFCLAAWLAAWLTSRKAPHVVDQVHLGG